MFNQSLFDRVKADAIACDKAFGYYMAKAR